MTSPFQKCRIPSCLSCTLIVLKWFSCTPWQKFQSTVESVQIRLPIAHFHLDKALPDGILLLPFRLFLRAKRKLENFSIYIRAKKSLAAIHYVIDFSLPIVAPSTFPVCFTFKIYSKGLEIFSTVSRPTRQIYRHDK